MCVLTIGMNEAKVNTGNQDSGHLFFRPLTSDTFLYYLRVPYWKPLTGTYPQMKINIKATENNADTTSAEPTEPTTRSFGTATDLGFDPLTDLNLPGSYEEAMARFSKLPGERPLEVLN